MDGVRGRRDAIARVSRHGADAIVHARDGTADLIGADTLDVRADALAHAGPGSAGEIAIGRAERTAGADRVIGGAGDAAGEITARAGMTLFGVDRFIRLGRTAAADTVAGA